jgi:hypothetical protein
MSPFISRAFDNLGIIFPSLSRETLLSITTLDSSKNEGNAGNTAFTFSILRTGNLNVISTVDWSVNSSGVTNPASGNDFAGGVFPSGTANFAIGVDRVDITVNVQGDPLIEPDENFNVVLSNPNNAEIIPGQGSTSGTILNDDFAPPPPTLSYPLTVSVFLVGGGGGGGGANADSGQIGNAGGGGGAGGVNFGDITVNATGGSRTWNITIGGGGFGSQTGQGGDGQSSSFLPTTGPGGFVSAGGGGGGAGQISVAVRNGRSGGNGSGGDAGGSSGGGGGATNTAGGSGGSKGAVGGGNGGSGGLNSEPNRKGCGGGGGGASFPPAGGTGGPAGGIGASGFSGLNFFLGVTSFRNSVSSVGFAGGGGGGDVTGGLSVGASGRNGGGTGAIRDSGATSGGSRTGSGGGGGIGRNAGTAGQISRSGGSGGSGVLVIKYPCPDNSLSAITSTPAPFTTLYDATNQVKYHVFQDRGVVSDYSIFFTTG